MSWSYVDHSALWRVVETGPSVRVDAVPSSTALRHSVKISHPPRETWRSSHRSHQRCAASSCPSTSSRASRRAVHQGRLRVPCASSATLGNSTERVNGRVLVFAQELERPFLGPFATQHNCRSGGGSGMQRSVSLCDTAPSASPQAAVWPGGPRPANRQRPTNAQRATRAAGAGRGRVVH